ncbi:hypothetical protein [Streptomyces carminius]|nr:hypothetical protein [Streptomyces carminius]
MRITGISTHVVGTPWRDPAYVRVRFPPCPARFGLWAEGREKRTPRGARR